jgi:hypothetical protein
VWGSRQSGKNRLLRRMALGVVKSLEVEDTSPTSAALITFQRGIGERFSRVEQLEHRVQMLLGIFTAKGALP